MTWSGRKSQPTGQKPVWLYEFTIGGTLERYTPRSKGYSYGGNVYSELAVVKGKIPETGEKKDAIFDFTLPASTAFAQSLKSGIGLQEATVKVLSGDEDDPDQEFLTRFFGRAIAFNSFFSVGEWGRVKVLCENKFTSGRRRTMPRVMDRTCSYALYVGGCALNIADFNTSGTATAISGNTLTIAEAALQADGYYTQGSLTYGAHKQLITEHTGNQITLLASVPGLATEIGTLGTASVEIAPGCTKLPHSDDNPSTCHTVFNNYLNFGGFPEMDETPFDGRTLT